MGWRGGFEYTECQQDENSASALEERAFLLHAGAEVPGSGRGACAGDRRHQPSARLWSCSAPVALVILIVVAFCCILGGRERSVATQDHYVSNSLAAEQVATPGIVVNPTSRLAAGMDLASRSSLASTTTRTGSTTSTRTQTTTTSKSNSLSLVEAQPRPAFVSSDSTIAVSSPESDVTQWPTTSRTTASWTTVTQTRTSFTVSTQTATTRTTSVSVFFDKEPEDDFPEIDYLYVPEIEDDIKRLARMKAEVVEYFPRRLWGIRLQQGVYPQLWPAGRYDKVKHFCRMLPKAKPECTWNAAGQDTFSRSFYAAAGADTLDDCQKKCCADEECRAIAFSASAADGALLRCLLYAHGKHSWKLGRSSYKDYVVHWREADVQKAWWEERNLGIARATLPGETFPTDGDPLWEKHHAGCGLSHLTIWLDALSRGLSSLVVFESDGFITRIEDQRFVHGNASDYADLLRALPKEAPADWYVIMLDKGTFGAHPGAKLVASIKPASSRGHRNYNLVRWGGRGIAGLAAYMVSRRFLSWVPHEILARGLQMVDAWIDAKCGPRHNDYNPNPIPCYSIVADLNHTVQEAVPANAPEEPTEPPEEQLRYDYET